MPPKETSMDLELLLGSFSSTHLPEIEEHFRYSPRSENTRIEIRTLHWHTFDGRRTWELKTVWFDNRPVMIIQNAGREGDDHCHRFVTDKALLTELVLYVTSLLPQPESDNDTTFVDIDEAREDLAYFYSESFPASMWSNL